MISEMTVAMTAKARSITDAEVIAVGADVGAVVAGVIAVAVHRAVPAGGTFRHPSMLRRRVANFVTTTIAIVASSEAMTTVVRKVRAPRVPRLPIAPKKFFCPANRWRSIATSL